VEPRTVQPALQRAAVELALGERDVGVAAGVVHRVDVAALGADDRDDGAVDVSGSRPLLGQLVHATDAHEVTVVGDQLCSGAHATSSSAMPGTAPSSASMTSIRCSEIS